MEGWFPFIRAPAHIRYGRGSDFEPKLVSIGPYYRGRKNLQSMEDRKEKCLFELHSKTSHGKMLLLPPSTSNSSSNIDRLVDQFKQLGAEAQHCFKYTDADFLRMLVLDSCFIIRIMMYVSQEVRESMAFPDLNIKEVRHDLLLMENQIPLFFIEGVYDWLSSNVKNQLPEFRAILEPFLFLDMSWPFNEYNIIKTNNFVDWKWTPETRPSGHLPIHLLDLYWKCCLPMGRVPPSIGPNFKWIPKFLLPSNRNSSLFNITHMGRLLREHPLLSTAEQRSWAEIHIKIDASKPIPNATELNTTAGIGFEKLNITSNDNPRKGLHVNFSNGIMELPCLKIDPSQKRLLVNLIAFEISMPPECQIFTSYVFLMDALIDSDKDVELLQQCGVINNTLHTHKMAAIFFNDIGNVCSVDSNGHLHSKFYNHVKKYYTSHLNRTRASLRHNYFNSLWGKISVAAATVLLILTVVQALFTILPYYYRR